MLFNKVQYLPNKQDLSCKMDQLSITTNPISGVGYTKSDNYKIIVDGLHEDQVLLILLFDYNVRCICCI